MPDRRKQTEQIPRCVEEGLCAFCGSKCDCPELVDEIHSDVERLCDLDPSDAAFAAAFEQVKRRFARA